MAVFLTLLMLWIVLKGPPLSLTALTMWLLAGTLALSLHDLRRWVLGVAVEWLPFVAFVFAYDLVRMYADRLMPTHVRPGMVGDRFLFGGRIPTIWLQQHLWHGAQNVRWYDYASWAVYMTFFVSTFLVAAALWVFAYHRFRRFVAMFAVLSLAGLATFVLFPTAPPWWAAKHGQLAAAPRLTGIVWAHTSSGLASAITHYQGMSDQVAAIPSLHAAFTLLITLFFWRSARWWWRIPLAAYPIAMGFALVYFAEHYVTGVLIGWAYAAVVFFAVARFARERSGPAHRLGHADLQEVEEAAPVTAH